VHLRENIKLTKYLFMFRIISTFSSLSSIFPLYSGYCSDVIHRFRIRGRQPGCVARDSFSASYLQLYSTLRTVVYCFRKKRCSASRTHPDRCRDVSMWSVPVYEHAHRRSVFHGTWRGRSVYNYRVSEQQHHNYFWTADGRPHHVILYDALRICEIDLAD
jgi:hypothetical protein